MKVEKTRSSGGKPNGMNIVAGSMERGFSP